MTSTDAPVVVAGAGIGGLTAALSLARHGVPVAVYERREGREIEMAGTGLTLWSNATSSLGTLGLGEALRERGDVITRVEDRTADDRLVFSTPIREFEAEGSLPSVSIARGTLVGTLLAACEEAGVPVHFGDRVTGYEDTVNGSDGAVTALLESGARVAASALVGGDGVRSAVRAQMVGDGEPGYLGVSTYRGVSAGSGGVEPGVIHMFDSPVPEALGGMAWHVGEGRVGWTVGMKAPRGQRDEPGTLRDEALALVEGVQGPARTFVAETDPADVIRTDILLRDWIEEWGRGPVTLLGDAAHAMPTVLGQGACQAVEDAVTLGACVAAAPDPVTGLRRYEEARLERVRWVRGQVWKLAKMQLAEPNPVAKKLFDLVGPLLIPRMQKRVWPRLLAAPAATPDVTAGAGAR